MCRRRSRTCATTRALNRDPQHDLVQQVQRLQRTLLPLSAPLLKLTNQLQCTLCASRKPLILVLEPSQELADQTHQMLSTFVKYLPAPIPRSVLIVGGQSAAQQVEELKKGADIVTATPGRLLGTLPTTITHPQGRTKRDDLGVDLVETSRIDLSNVRFFVLDEADSLLDQGSKDMVMAIFRSLNTANKLQTLMFSATLHSPEIGTLAEEICRFPTWVDLKGKDSVPEVGWLGLAWLGLAACCMPSY